MDVSYIILSLGFVVIVAILVWLVVRLSRRRSHDDISALQSSLEMLRSELIGRQLEGLVTIRESLDVTNKLLNDRLSEGSQVLDRRLELFGKIENRLGQLEQQAGNLEEIGRNIQSLSDLLKPPSVRGGVGELMLENLLQQILPSALYETQFTFVSGQRVDAIVRLGDRLLPIDAKFALDHYARLVDDPDDKDASKAFAKSLKKQIDEIASKYIHPDQQTTDFAIMYIPSEAVYSEMIGKNQTTLFEYALSRKVIPSSPGHLYAFLATISVSLQSTGLSRDSGKLASTINSIHDSIQQLRKNHGRIEGSLRSLSQSLAKANESVNEMDSYIDSLQPPSECTAPSEESLESHG